MKEVSEEEIQQEIKKIVNGRDQVLLHIAGGQPKKLFSELNHIEGIETLDYRSVVHSRIWKFFLFIPSHEGLILLKGKEVVLLLNLVRKMIAGTSLFTIITTNNTDLVNVIAAYEARKEIIPFCKMNDITYLIISEEFNIPLLETNMSGR